MAETYPRLARWFKRMRTLPICAADLRRTRDYLVNLKDRDFERRRIFWRGDRIEWLLARGFHAWFFDEIRQDRVPGRGCHCPRRCSAAPPTMCAPLKVRERGDKAGLSGLPGRPARAGPVGSTQAAFVGYVLCTAQSQVSA